MPAIVKQNQTKVAKKPSTDDDWIVPVNSMNHEFITINLFGRNGTGKTSLLCTFPKPLLIIGFEDGTASIKKIPGVDYAVIPNCERAVKLSERLQNGHGSCWRQTSKGLVQTEPGEGDPYLTVGLDTVTSLQDVVLKELLGLEESPVQLAWGTVSQTQYRQRSEKTKEVIRKYLGLKSLMNVVLLAQEKNHTEKDGEGGGEVGSELLMPFVAASIGKSACGWLCENVDYICQTFVREKVETGEVKIGDGKKSIKTSKSTGEIEFCLRTQKAHPVFAAKMRVDRGVNLPDVLVDPSYAKLRDLIDG